MSGVSRSPRGSLRAVGCGIGGTSGAMQDSGSLSSGRGRKMEFRALLNTLRRSSHGESFRWSCQ